MAYFWQSLVTKPSSVVKCMIAGLGTMFVVVVVFFSLSYIFFTSTLLILCTAYFLLSSSQNPKNDSKPNYQIEEEANAIVLEQVAHSMQGQEGFVSIHRAYNLNYLPTISENESIFNDYDDNQFITPNEDEEYGCGNVALFSKENDGSISDEDTLIEIELLTGHYLSPSREFELHNIKLKRNLLPDCYRHQPSRMELLSEEDNLIEIDISIGSVMHPSFETEAPLVY